MVSKQQRLNCLLKEARSEKEWATQMSIKALACALKMVIRVVSTHAKDRYISAFFEDYTDNVGLTETSKALVVGFNKETQHYIGFGTMPLFVIQPSVCNENGVDVVPSVKTGTQSESTTINRMLYSCEIGGCCYANNNRKKLRMHLLGKHKFFLMNTQQHLI